MVLDPLSAFAVACNIIQVLEVGCRLIVGANERIKDGSDLASEHRELRDVSRTISNLSSSLGASLKNDTNTTKLSSNEQRLMGANEECLRIPKEFINLLDRLKVKERRAVVENFKMSLKAYWFRDKIDAMQKALSQARDNLNFAFLLYMNWQQTTNAEKTQDGIHSSTSALETKLTAMIESSSSQTQLEIRKIAEELKEAYLDSDSDVLSTFLSSDHNILETLSKRVEALSLSQKQDRDEAYILQESLTQRKILDSLSFPEMHQRYDQVAYAQRQTYQWMLRPLEDQRTQWSCFYSWLQASECSQRTYWVQGKPGSGKSTLLKFLDENIDAGTHMASWCGDLPVYKARFFFWHSGTTLQKSLSGFSRTLLSDLLDQRPGLIPSILGSERWEKTTLSTASPIIWRDPDLRSTLQRTITSLCSCAKVFLIIDGIDEFDGTNDEQESLLSFLLKLNTAENLKLCISSRPWNIFQDVFGRAPQLRLEDLTKDDMVFTVTSLFEANPRWSLFCAGHTNEMKSLITEVVRKSHGVFLWIRLVMRDLLNGIRDGDSLEQLQMKLVQMPDDLHDYFKRMIDLIEPQHRREASMMLQLACFQETNFISLAALRLPELCFLHEKSTDFALMPNFGFDIFGLNNVNGSERLRFQIDSTMRKLHSRCMGLLECSHQSQKSRTHRKIITVIEEVNLNDLEGVFALRIDFLHRSLREFLATPHMQEFLHFHTNGALDARRYLCNARLAIFMALFSLDATRRKAIGRAANLIPALSVRGTSEWASRAFAVMQTNLARLAESRWAEHDERKLRYIISSLRSWMAECSSPLTMAIDFGLTTYVLAHLTTETIKSKKGRPILDYILRPRFLGTYNMQCGYHQPDIKLLQTALALGADPNEKHGPRWATVWETFLCLWGEGFHHNWFYASVEDRARCQTAFTQALMLLLRAGARPAATWIVLATEHPYERYDHPLYDGLNADERFKLCWPDATPLRGSTEFYLVSSLLSGCDQFHEPPYSDFMDELRTLEHNYFALEPDPVTTESDTESD